jgi:hypothetical protein
VENNKSAPKEVKMLNFSQKSKAPRLLVRNCDSKVTQKNGICFQLSFAPSGAIMFSSA